MKKWTQILLQAKEFLGEKGENWTYKSLALDQEEKPINFSYNAAKSFNLIGAIRRMGVSNEYKDLDLFAAEYLLYIACKRMKLGVTPDKIENWTSAKEVLERAIGLSRLPVWLIDLESWLIRKFKRITSTQDE